MLFGIWRLKHRFQKRVYLNQTFVINIFEIYLNKYVFVFFQPITVRNE